MCYDDNSWLSDKSLTSTLLSRLRINNVVARVSVGKPTHSKVLPSPTSGGFFCLRAQKKKGETC